MFIEVTKITARDNCKTLVNVLDIHSIEGDREGSSIRFNNNVDGRVKSMTVKESYDEIKQLITEAKE